uniref:MbtH family protein n=1 Tax=Streptomyces sp. NBC_00003 TaxID=2903608 RepID=A0AAU2UZL1_9ACTN
MARINPFDDAEGSYYALLDGQGHHSLWPSFADIPAGWTVAYGPAGRQVCLDHINDSRPGPRPATAA